MLHETAKRTYWEVDKLAGITDEVGVWEDDGIATITIKRSGRRNALSRSLLAQLVDMLASFEDARLRAVVLEGAHGCFSAGADLTELDGSLADLTMDEAVGRAADAVRGLSIAVIAAIEGPCVGAAVELAMACDLRVASATAFFQVPAVRLGILYRPGAIAQLARRLPPDVLTRLLLFGERVDAEDAGALGLVVAPVVPPGQARERARNLAQLLPVGPWPAARATKRLLAAVATGSKSFEGFEAERRKLAASKERLVALAEARRRHTRRTT